MAEAATVIQILDFAIKTVALLYQGIETLIQAPTHVESLSREVRISKDILLSARRAIEGLPIPLDHPVSSIEEFIENGNASNKSLELAIRGLQQGDGVRRVKWVFERNRCRNLEVQVKQHSDHAFKVVQLFATETYFKQLAEGARVRLAVPAGEFIGPQPPNTLTWSPSECPTSPELPASTSEDRLYIPKESSTTQLIPASRRCSLACKCDCHTTLDRRYSKSSRRNSFTSRVGSLSHTRRCSIKGCRLLKGQGQSEEFRFTLPLASFQKFFVLSILWRGFKMQPSLRTQRFVSETSDVVKYTQMGDLDSLKRLFELGLADVNDSELDGWTILMTATYYGIGHVAKYLIEEKKADTSAFEIKSRKASHFAMIKAVKKNASAEDKVLVEYFPKAEEEFKKDFAFSPILVAVLDLYEDSDIERPSLLNVLDCASSANNAKTKDDWAALDSKYEGKSNLFRQILDRCRHDGTKIRDYQDFLNENDAVHGWPPAHWAAYIGDLEKMKILLLKGAEPQTITSSGRNLFHLAAESGNPDVMAYLIDSKYPDSLDINLPDLWKETPLHIAATQDQKSVSLLLQNGAKVDAVQKDNQTPLHCASRADEKERPHIVKLLAEHDINRKAIKMVDDGSLTPIFLFLRSPKCLKTLLENGADLHIRDKQDRTLIHHACREGQAESLKLLLEAGEFKLPTLMRRDSEGVNPLDEAMSRGKADCAKRMLEKLSNITWDDDYAKRLLLGASRIGDPDLLEQVLGLKLLDEYSMARRAGEARRAAADEGMDKERVSELLDELNRRKGHIPRESVSKASTAEVRATYFAIR